MKMSSFLCFICHNGVNSATTEETREKYRDIVGMNLCPYSHLCYICCHMVNKLWMFKSMCLKRSLEYPVLFSEKFSPTLHRSDIEMLILCNDDCLPTNTNQLHICYTNDQKELDNDYVKLEDEKYDDVVDNVEDNDVVKDNEQIDVERTMVLEKAEGNDNDDNNDTADFNDFATNEDYRFDDEKSTSKKRSKKNEQTDFKKVVLTLEQQKAELDAQRKSKKYLEAEFKCYNCAQGFLFKDSYQTHMMRHEESNGEHVCLLCTLRFASLAVLRSHKCGHKERYICLHCGANVKKRQRHTHARKHNKEEVNAACHLCGNVFQDASGLQQHLKRFHRSKASNRTYSCSVCAKTYNNQAAVRSHMITHIQRKFACDHCSAYFSSPYTLNQHKKRHTLGTTAKEHMCVSCGVGYTTRKSLLAHMRTALQHQETVFECPICSRICPNSTSLSLHIARVHSTSKDYQCNQCTNKYTTRNGLLRHIREHTSHPKTVMAQCFICGKSFKNNSRLNRHLREVCRKDKLEEELSNYNIQQEGLLVDMADQPIGN